MTTSAPDSGTRARKASRNPSVSSTVLCIFQLAARTGVRSGILKRLHSGQLAPLDQLERGAAAGRDPVHGVREIELVRARRPSRHRRRRCGPARRRQPRPTARVPASKGGTSKAPIGPFQKTVPAPAIRLEKLAVVLLPTSSPIQPSGTSTPFSSRVSVPASSSLPRTRSSGSSRMLSLFSDSGSTRLAASTPSSSTSELPVSRPSAAKKLKHIAPPIRISSAKPRKRSMTPSLSVTLAPPRTTTSGRFGSSRTAVSCATSCSSRRPA